MRERKWKSPVEQRVFFVTRLQKISIYFHVEDIDKTLDPLDFTFCKLTVDQINQRQPNNESVGRVFFLVELSLGWTTKTWIGKG